MNNKQQVPDKFVKDFIKIMPSTLINEIKLNGYEIESFSKKIIEDYYNNIKHEESIKKNVDLYFSRNKKKFYSNTISAFNGDPKYLKLLYPYSEVFKEGLRNLDVKGSQLYDDWFSTIAQWKNDYKSLLCEYVFFNNLSDSVKKNILKKDLLKLLIAHVIERFSGSRSFIYEKSTSAILDFSFFGHPKSIDVDNNIVSRGGTSLSYDRVNIFSEHDAKVFDACYHLGFNQLLLSSTMYVNISDVTMYVYGNYASKNKDKVIESINKFAQFGYKANLDNDDIYYSDEFYFFQRTTILEEKKNVRKKVIARIVLNDEYRKHTLKTLSLSYNQSFEKIEMDVKYSFLMNQYILKIRNDILQENTIEHKVKISDLKNHINFSDTEKICEVLIPALESLKESETYLEDYNITDQTLFLFIEGVDTSEGAQIQMLKQVINNQINFEKEGD